MRRCYAKYVENYHDFNITTEDIKMIIVFLMFSDSHTLPSERDCGSEAEDVGIDLVKNAFLEHCSHQKCNV